MNKKFHENYIKMNNKYINVMFLPEVVNSCSTKIAQHITSRLAITFSNYGDRKCRREIKK